MKIDIFVHVVGSKEWPGEDPVTYDLEFNSAFDVTDLASVPYAVTGGGETRGSIGIPAGNEFGADATWNLAGSVTDSRCPTGEFAVAIGDFRFEAVFDGSGGMDWEIRDESGERVSWSTHSPGCGE
jgi:hypothetical protein